MAFWKREKKGPPEENPEGRKKPGFIRRLWRKFRSIDWKNPVNRWKLLFVSLFIVIFGLTFVGGAIAFTNSPSFCKACHEMAPEHVTFEKSAHNQVTCVQCHIAPGNVEMVLHKIGSLKEVYYHITGVPDPIVQTVAVLDENCEQCHSKNRLVTATGDLIVNHDGHIKEGIPCVVCHSGVAHAKVVERGINGSESYDAWTMENSDKLMDKKYMSPNMGTCIDCHNKVNQGEKPWKDYSYQVPENPHGEEHGKKEESTDEAKAAELSAAEVQKVSHQETQDIILQAIGKQKTDVKVSMECFTCHQEINTPKNHDIAEWNQNHGGYAYQELNKCVNCHQDEKWIRRFEKQNIDELLKTGNEKETYTANMVEVKTQSRENHFCSTCHKNRPAGHLDSDAWLTAHAPLAQTNEQKANCYVCHDREKPTTDTKAPTDVYCQYCHRTGFKGEEL